MIRPAVLAALQGIEYRKKKIFNSLIIFIHLGYNTTVLAYGQTASGNII
jgi:hypothetical protein